MTCAIMVNTQTHIQTAFDRLYYQLSQLSSKHRLLLAFTQL